MREYQTTAFILSKQAQGEYDEKISLYCKDTGKLYAFAKSSRKASSKLAAHLQPQQKISVRLIEKNRIQVVDALSAPQRRSIPFEILHALDQLSNIEEFDPLIWGFLETGKYSSRELLKILGFDSQFAACFFCSVQATTFFSLTQQFYLCQACAEKTKGEGLLLVE